MPEQSNKTPDQPHTAEKPDDRKQCCEVKEGRIGDVEMLDAYSRAITAVIWLLHTNQKELDKETDLPNNFIRHRKYLKNHHQYKNCSALQMHHP